MPCSQTITLSKLSSHPTILIIRIQREREREGERVREGQTDRQIIAFTYTKVENDI